MVTPSSVFHSSMFTPVTACWVCGGTSLAAYHSLRFELDAFRSGDQDHELADYSGQRLDLLRCADCGFGQPAALPTLPNYFDRLYDQRWDPQWVVNEFEGASKDFIFRVILRELDRRVPKRPRTLLDVGAHAGRFLHFAREARWEVEGIELNPRTAAYAATRTGATVHRINAHELASTNGGRQYEAVVLTDVLEHVPDPVRLLTTLAALTAPGGVIAVKVPCGRSQVLKEQALAALTAHQVTLADNLVHVNHFSPRSLRFALERAGFRADVGTAAPELPPRRPLSIRTVASSAIRLAAYGLGRLPGAVHTPFALNLQAFGTRQ